MKYIVLSDVHLHHQPKWRLAWLQDFLNRFYNYYKNIDYPLIISGDFFESRDRLDGTVLNTALDFITKWKHSPIFWITGQHDQLHPGVATLRGIHGVRDNIIVVDEDIYQVNDNIVLVPYARSLDTYKQFLDKVRALGNPGEKIIFTHTPVFDVLGKVIKGNSEEAGMAMLKHFADFKYTISGDIHKPPDFNANFKYVGMVAPRNWQDRHAVGAYGEFDEETCTLKRIATMAPEFIELPCDRFNTPGIKFHIKVKKGFELPENKKDVVMSQQTVIETVAPQKQLTESELRNINDENIVLKNFVDKNGNESDKKKLLSFGLNIVKEISQTQ